MGKVLLCEQEDLSSNLQPPHKSWAWQHLSAIPALGKRQACGEMVRYMFSDRLWLKKTRQTMIESQTDRQTRHTHKENENVYL